MAYTKWHLHSALRGQPVIRSFSILPLRSCHHDFQIGAAESSWSVVHMTQATQERDWRARTYWLQTTRRVFLVTGCTLNRCRYESNVFRNTRGKKKVNAKGVSTPRRAENGAGNGSLNTVRSEKLGEERVVTLVAKSFKSREQNSNWACRHVICPSSINPSWECRNICTDACLYLLK